MADYRDAGLALRSRIELLEEEMRALVEERSTIRTEIDELENERLNIELQLETLEAPRSKSTQNIEHALYCILVTAFMGGMGLMGWLVAALLVSAIFQSDGLFRASFLIAPLPGAYVVFRVFRKLWRSQVS